MCLWFYWIFLPMGSLRSVFVDTAVTSFPCSISLFIVISLLCCHGDQKVISTIHTIHTVQKGWKLENQQTIIAGMAHNYIQDVQKKVWQVICLVGFKNWKFWKFQYYFWTPKYRRFWYLPWFRRFPQPKLERTKLVISYTILALNFKFV